MIPATLRPRRSMHSANQDNGGAGGLSHLVCIHVEVSWVSRGLVGALGFYGLRVFRGFSVLGFRAWRLGF